MENVSLGIEVDSTKVQAATAAMHELAAAAEKVKDALASLGLFLSDADADDADFFEPPRDW